MRAPAPITPGDVIGTLMVVVSTIWGIWKVRGERRSAIDPVVMTSIPGLIISSAVFFAIALGAAAFGVTNLVLHPTDRFHSNRIGTVHDWATGLVALEVGAAMGLCGSLLVGKARRSIRARVPAVIEPVPVVVPVPPDPAKARQAALAALDRAPDAHALAAIARRFLADAYGTEVSKGLTGTEPRATEWRALLDALDAARWSNSAVTGLEERLRELVV
jgi:hypothetical protein